MSGINKVFLIGRLGQDPRVNHLDNGNTVASFSLATSESYTDKNGEKKESTEWHNVVIWGRLAEVVEQYVFKGMQLYIEGKLKTRNYEKDGQRHYVTEIFANNMQMLGGKKEQTAAENYHDATYAKDKANTYSNSDFEPQQDDLPF